MMYHLNIELEGVKHAVAAHLGTHESTINNLVVQELDKVLSEDWVVTEIKKSVRDAVKSAVASISSDYGLQRVLKEVLLAELCSKLEVGNNA